MSLTGEKRLAITFPVTLLIMTGEMVGGFLSNSLALLSDAGHMVTDALAIALGLVAVRISRKPADRKATFGYQRVGLGEVETTRKNIESILQEAGVHHSTLQMECSSVECGGSLYCRSEPCGHGDTHDH